MGAGARLTDQINVSSKPVYVIYASYVYMYVYMYIYICMYVYIHRYIGICMYVYIHRYIGICMYVYIHRYIGFLSAAEKGAGARLTDKINYRSLLQNIVSCIWLFCKRDL